MSRRSRNVTGGDITAGDSTGFAIRLDIVRNGASASEDTGHEAPFFHKRAWLRAEARCRRYATNLGKSEARATATRLLPLSFPF